jgi:sulfatase modifying factor 1
MSTERMLLEALHADPGDHGARLALADALEEAGRAAQAELLRLHARQMTRAGTREELGRLCELLASGVRPVVPLVVNSVGMRLALVPPGTFLMGSPEGEPDRSDDEHQHEVALTRPFYLGACPVTQGEYQAVMGKSPSWFRRGKGSAGNPGAVTDTSRLPVESVSWEEAVEFCHRLTENERKEGIIGREQEYRLPTEAQWEYSCRGGAASHQVFHFGDALSSFQANFDGNLPYGGAGEGPYLERTCPAGSCPPNAFGLHEMHGNVWEWCHDWYAEDTYRKGPCPRVNPQGPAQDSFRVFRGGSWFNRGQHCRSAFRGRGDPAARNYNLGFRASLVSSGAKE